ncbi:MAG: bifunctional DNA primase/polymerase [Thermoplasmatales archaeon]|nr:bifunctional DNA primase/polymerase [Thermoplasmatales archaeon]
MNDCGKNGEAKRTGFIGQLVTNLEVFGEIPEIIKQYDLIPYDGSFKPYKIYHLTIEKPQDIDKLNLKKYRGKGIKKGKISDVKIYSNKLVFLLDSKKHVTVAEGKEVKTCLDENKDTFKRYIGTNLEFGNAKIISKVDKKDFEVTKEEALKINKELAKTSQPSKKAEQIKTLKETKEEEQPATETESWIWFYRKEGLNVIPAPKKTKFPSIKWKDYEKKFVDDETIETWVKKGKFENIFLILGSISNNTIEIDADVPDIELDDLFEDVEAAKKKVWIAESSAGKKKIYCRAEKPRNKDDQVVSNEQTGVDKKGNPTYPHVEYRGEGQGSILPPSTHPTGIKYKWLNLDRNGKLPSLETIDADELYDNIVRRLREKFDFKVEGRIKKDGTPVKKPKGRPRYCYLESRDSGDEWRGTEGHDFRVSAVAELIHKNWSDKEIHEFFKTHDEKSGEKYNYDITQKQINWARENQQYDWLCPTIQRKCGTIVSQYCDQCPRNKKEDLSIYVSTRSLPDGKHLEEILVDGIERFILYDKKNDTWEIINDYMYGDTPIRPYKIDLEQRDAVVFPDGIEEYGTLESLCKEMLDFAMEEYDPVDDRDLYELTINLFLTSWISPVWQKYTAEKFIPIVNPRGPSETGKKRFLTVARWLTYHSLYGLKTNRVPTLFRAIAPLEGTLILDEADMNDSTLSSELVEFLNSRCDGVPIPRYSTDSRRTEWWKSFGMTVLATREGFTDDGLESRCTVMPTATTDNPEKYHLIPPKEWMEKGKKLQRKLLLFKLRHLDGEMPTQLIIPNISSFRVRESLLVLQGLKDEDPELFKNVSKLAVALQERIIKERAASPEGLMLNVIYDVITDEKTHREKEGVGYILLQEGEATIRNSVPVRKEMINVPLNLRQINKALGEAFSSSKIAKMWRGMQQDTLAQKKVDGRKYRGVMIIKNMYRLDKIFPKYVPGYETPKNLKEKIAETKLPGVDD